MTWEGDSTPDRPDDLHDRPRGVLTQHDRRWLAGELDEELNKNAAAQKRYKIRKRVKNALLDFDHLHRLSDEDIKLILDSLGSETYESWQFENGNIGALQFIYQTLGRDVFIEAVEQILAHEIRYNYADQGLYADVGVDIQVDVGEPAPMKEKVKQMTRDEIKEDAYLQVTLAYLHQSNPELYDQLAEIIESKDQ